MPMEIAVRLTLRNIGELEQLKRDQQDPSSSSYHRGLTAAQFNARFGPTPADANAVAQWLSAAGLVVTGVDLDSHLVRAQANAAVVSRAFDVAIARNASSFANTIEPAIPAALAPLVANIEGLNNTFAVKPALIQRGDFEPLTDLNGSASPDFKGSQGLGFSPTDLRNYYDETPLINGGNTGTRAPDCIAVAEVSNLHLSSVNAFDAEFGLPAVSLRQITASRTKPGYNSAELEAALDVEYAHAIAPATPIRLYAGSGTNDLQDAITRAVTDNACGVISISYGYCGQPASFYTETLGQLFTQAALQRQTVFISSGDEGAAGLVLEGDQCVTARSPHISEMSAHPDVTSIGGTQFNAQYNSAGGNISGVLNGLDSAWDENDQFQGATGGGTSAVFARPSWQTGTGVPAGTMRLVPDVALGASGSAPGFYVVAFENGENQLGLVAGTSIGAPTWAGYSRLIAKVLGNKGRLGPINQRIYQLGEIGSESGLIDVVGGNNTFGFVPGFSAGTGYDMATGWGSPDMAAMLNSFLDGGTASTVPANVSATPKTVIADAGALTITNTSGGTVSIDSIKVTMTRPGVFKTLSMSCGGPAASTVRGTTTTFSFRQPVAIPIDGVATCTMTATLASLTRTYTSAETLTNVTGTVAGEGVTFEGVPASLGTITLAP